MKGGIRIMRSRLASGVRRQNSTLKNQSPKKEIKWFTRLHSGVAFSELNQSRIVVGPSGQVYTAIYIWGYSGATRGLLSSRGELQHPNTPAHVRLAAVEPI